MIAAPIIIPSFNPCSIGLAIEGPEWKLKGERRIGFQSLFYWISYRRPMRQRY